MLSFCRGGTMWHLLLGSVLLPVTVARQLSLFDRKAGCASK